MARAESGHRPQDHCHLGRCPLGRLRLVFESLASRKKALGRTISVRQRTFGDQKSWLLRPCGRAERVGRFGIRGRLRWVDWVGRFGIRGRRQWDDWVGRFGIRGRRQWDDWVGRFGIRGRRQWDDWVGLSGIRDRRQWDDWIGRFEILGRRQRASKDRLFLDRAPRGGQRFYGHHHPSLRSWDLGIRFVGFGRQAASQRAWARTRFARRWAGVCGDSRYKGSVLAI